MITVSVCVATYNHEKYIDDCIQSIVNQVHDFDIEILVHDDASTDGTTNKIRNWQKKYPDLIFPIIQEVNQYSIQPIIAPKFIFPKARGVYIALCEGDDYWIDETKLSSQVEILESNENIDLCFHDTLVRSANKLNISSDKGNTNSISYVSGALVPNKKKTGRIHTSSLMFRRASISSVPPWIWRAAPVGDLFIQAMSGKNGAIKLNKSMSIYRTNISDSYTGRSYNYSIFQILNKLAHSYLATIGLLVSRRIYFSQLKSLLLRFLISYLSLLKSRN